MDYVSDAVVTMYIGLLVNSLSGGQMALLARTPDGAAQKIETKIDAHLPAHRMRQFRKGMDQGRIVGEPYWQFPAAMLIQNHVQNMAKALYDGEYGMNPLVQRMTSSLAALPDIVWRHRNPSESACGFRLNGYLSHYPDLIAYTRRGHVHPRVINKG